MTRLPRIVTLDGLRGVAAVLVVIYHSSSFMGESTWVPGAYLCVDLFFVMSGFVLAGANDDQLQTGTGQWRFMAVRAIRFYPVLLIGLLLAFALKFVKYEAYGQGEPPFALLTMLIVSLVFSPDFASDLIFPALPGSVAPFPLIPPMWSLFFEFVANGLYAFIHRLTHGAWMTLLLSVSAGSLIVIALKVGSLSGGSTWSSLWIGLPRVAFSFFVGVLIYRKRRHIPRWCRSVSPLILGSLLVAVVSVQGVKGIVELRDILFVLILSPMLVACASVAQPSAATTAAMNFLGAASYPIYVLHWPLALRLRPFTDLANGPKTLLFVGAFTTMMILMGAACDRWFDRPIRKHLLRLLGTRSAARIGREALPLTSGTRPEPANSSDD